MRQPARIPSLLETYDHVPSVHILSQMNPIHMLVPRLPLVNEYQNNVTMNEPRTSIPVKKAAES